MNISVACSGIVCMQIKIWFWSHISAGSSLKLHGFCNWWRGT